MFKIALYTGFRISEIALLEKANIITIDDVLYFDIIKGKTDNAPRTIPVHSKILDIVKAKLKTKSKYIFVDDVSVNAITKKVNKAINQLIPTPTKTFHSFRKNFTSKLYDNYANYEVYIKVLVGHSVESNITYSTYAGKKFSNDKTIEMIESIKY